MLKSEFTLLEFALIEPRSLLQYLRLSEFHSYKAIEYDRG